MEKNKLTGVTQLKKAKDGHYGVVTFGRSGDKDSIHRYRTRKCKTSVSAKRYCKIFCDNMKLNMTIK